MSIFTISIGASVISLFYGAFLVKLVMAKSAGNEKMKEIQLAIEQGAKAYLRRQNKTVLGVGCVISILWLFG